MRISPTIILPFVRLRRASTAVCTDLPVFCHLYFLNEWNIDLTATPEAS